MASIKFILKSSANPSAIYVRLVDGRKTDVMARTKFVINPADWSSTKQQPKNLNDTDFKKLNSDLQDIRSDLLKHYNKTTGLETINTHWLKDFLNPLEKTPGPPTGLIKYLEAYIAFKKKTVTANSLKKYNVIKHKLIRYDKEHKKETQIVDVGPAFQKSFEDYCTKYKYSHNTITMEIRFLKTLCRHANRENGLDVHPRLESIKNRYEDVENIYLDEIDLAKIKNIEDGKLSDSLDNVRDWLLISCYTGQRISDFLRFNKGMIRQEQNKNGKLISLIEFEQKKTGKIMTLPLHKEVLRILDKRNGEFPSAISDQKYNEYIKQVCEEAGLTEIIYGSKKTETAPKSKVFRKESGNFKKWELVSSHIGRRSFATNFYGVIPTSLLIAATGHSTEQMFLNYIGKSSSDRAKELAEYF